MPVYKKDGSPIRPYPKNRVRNKNNPELQRARTRQMLVRRIQGYTIPQIAEEMKCAPETVQRLTREAIQKGVLDDIEHKLLTELLPKAAKVYEKRLEKDLESDDPDIEAARDVLKGTRVFAGSGGGGPIAQPVDQDTLEFWIRGRRTVERPDPIHVSPGDVQEGETIPGPGDLETDDPTGERVEDPR